MIIIITIGMFNNWNFIDLLKSLKYLMVCWFT